MSYKPWEQTAQLQFKNCLNFSQNEQVRGGCRGGRDQFSWDALRTMKYNDRIHYLGQTVVIGYLDKGGKWRKRDWYTKLTDEDKNRVVEKEQVKTEIEKVKEDDEKRLKIALGLEKPGQDSTMKKLSKEELDIITKKIKGEGTKIPVFDPSNTNPEPEIQNFKGLGFDKKVPGKVQLKSTYGETILEAYGIQDDYKKPSLVQPVDKPLQIKVKEEKKKEKKHKDKKSKKEKKEKKLKEKKHKHRRSSSSSSSDNYEQVKKYNKERNQ